MALETDVRAARALELRLAGMSYDDIAARLGYANKGGAFKAVRRALGAPRRPTASGKLGGPYAAAGGPLEGADGDDMKATITTMILRLDAMRAGIWPKARRGDLDAIAMVLRIGQRRDELVALMELYAPPVKAPPTALSAFEERMRGRERKSRGD